MAPHLLVLARAPVVVPQDLGGQARERRQGAGAARRSRAGQLGGVEGRVQGRLAALDRGVAVREELRVLSSTAGARSTISLRS